MAGAIWHFDYWLQQELFMKWTYYGAPKSVTLNFLNFHSRCHSVRTEALDRYYRTQLFWHVGAYPPTLVTKALWVFLEVCSGAEEEKNSILSENRWRSVENLRALLGLAVLVLVGTESEEGMAATIVILASYQIILHLVLFIKLHCKSCYRTLLWIQWQSWHNIIRQDVDNNTFHCKYCPI